MQKMIVFISILILILSLSSCAHTTADNDSPQALYKNDTSIDLLVYNETAFVNAADLDWVAELELISDKKLGKIQRTGVTKKFTEFDATLLEIGTEVYSVADRADFVLVSIGNVMVPYYAYVEG